MLANWIFFGMRIFSLQLDLIQAGVPTELHVYPGAYHASEVFAPEAALSQSILVSPNRSPTTCAEVLSQSLSHQFLPVTELLLHYYKIWIAAVACPPNEIPPESLKVYR